MQIRGKGLECSPFGSGECEEQQGQEGGLGENLKQKVSTGGGGGEAGERDGCHSTCDI